MDGRLPSGCTPLDEILGGGFRFGDVSLIYGEASTGKTTLALSCALNHLRGDPWAKAYYVDSDQKLSTVRLTQLAEGDGSLLGRLLVWTPSGFSEQTGVIERLQGLIHGSVPIVVDSITGPYRLEAGDARKTFSANKELNRQLGFLSETAKANGAAILVVGQVHGVIGAEAPQVEPVAKRLLNYWSDTILRLETTSVRSVRQALLEKPVDLAGACRFMLTEAGIEEVKRAW
jgi:DNA repair protein RadB